MARGADEQSAGGHVFRPEQPWSPAEYVRHESTSGRVALWGLDASLIAAATLGTVLIRRKSEQFVVTDDVNNPLTSDL